MLAGLSSRRYSAGLEPAGQAVEEVAAATSKSAVSSRFVAAIETTMAELMSKRLDGIDGTKHPLGVEEGSTENAAVVTGLITGMRDRGLDTSRPILAVLDGAKALSTAVKDVFGKPVIHRFCTGERLQGHEAHGLGRGSAAVADQPGDVLDGDASVGHQRDEAVA